MKVKILFGGYGHRPKGSKSITLVLQGETCEVDEAEGRYLVRQGAAVEVKAEGAESEAGSPLPEADEGSAMGNLSEAENGLEGADLEFDGKSLGDMSYEELKATAEGLGMETKYLRSKQSLREAISAFVGDEADDSEAPPDIEASEVVS